MIRSKLGICVLALAVPLLASAASSTQEDWLSAIVISRAAEAKARKCEAGIMTSHLEDCAELMEYVSPKGRFRELAGLQRSFTNDWIESNGYRAEYEVIAQRVQYTSSILQTYVEMLPRQ